MKKDVIYIDIEDDITSIIEKIKNSSSKIVALIPPKRTGVLQSLVNLKLLKRTAQSIDKRIVLITSDNALSSLAAGVEIPVARNLQSKPEIAAVTALAVDNDDVIDGGGLPVGEHAATRPLDDVSSQAVAVAPSATPLAMTAANRAPKKAVAIPNFDNFRKRLFLFGGLGLLLIGFIVWAVWFAPHATVAITAKTTPYSVNKPLSLKPGASLDSTRGVAVPVYKELKKSVSVDFAATGKKEVGEKATGPVKFSRQSMSSTTVPAGTVLTSDVTNLTFVTNTPVTIPASTLGGACFPTACPGTATASVTASERGSKYNGVSGSLSGAPDSVSASFTAPSAGGTDKTVTVVSADDVAKAKEKLAAQDANAVKAELKKQFSSSQVAIDESFLVAAGEPASSPAVDGEATNAKLTAETVYSLVGLEKNDVQKIIETDINNQLQGTSNQKIYDTGLNNLRFTSYQKQADGASAVTLVATGMVGPKIDSAKLAQQLAGKRTGEIQAIVRGIDGVDSVNTELSPFWVTKAPAEDRITIKFVVRNAPN